MVGLCLVHTFVFENLFLLCIPCLIGLMNTSVHQKAEEQALADVLLRENRCVVVHLSLAMRFEIF